MAHRSTWDHPSPPVRPSVPCTTISGAGGAIWLAGDIALAAEPLSIRGTGITTTGALRNVSGSNSVSGVVTLAANGTQINSDAGTLTISNGIVGTFDLVFGGAGDIVVSGTIGTGAAIVEKVGTGRLTLSGSSNNSDVTTISAGVLRAQNNFALGATGAATEVVAGAALELAGGITITGEPLTISGSGVSSTGALRNVSGTNSFTGTITAGGATLFTADADTQLTLSALSGNPAKTFGGAGNIAVTGIIAGNAGMTMAGSGTLTLSAANSITGAFSLTSGVVRATSVTGALGGGTLTLNGGLLELANDTGLNFARNTTVSTSGTIFSERLTSGTGVTHTLGTLAISSQSLTLATDSSVTSGTAGLTFGNVTLSTPGGATFNANAGTLLTLGAVSGNAFGFTVGGAGDTRISGVIGTTTGTLTKTGAGTLTLAAANTYSGLTTIAGGTLRYGVANTLGIGPITIQDGATLDLSTFSDSVGAVTLTDGNIVGSGTLTSTANFATTSGTISASLAGTVGLVQGGNGTTVLSASNSFSGTTTVSAGTLVLANSGALANSVLNVGTGASGAVSFGSLTSVSVGGLAGGNNLALVNAGSDGVNLTIGGTGQTSSYSGVLSGDGSLTKVGTGSLTLGNANTYTGSTAILSGTASTGSIVVAGGASGLGDASSAVTLGDAATQGVLSYTGNTATYTRGFTLGAGGGRLDVTTAGQTLTIDTADVTGSGTFTVGGAGNVIMNAALQQTNGLTKVGNGTLTLAAANTYTGTTTVSAGVLNVQNASALGSTAAGVTVAGGAALELQGGITISTEALSIAGTGIASGGALRNVSGSNTYGGAITQTAATQINSDADLLTLSGAIGGAFNLAFGGAGSVTASNVIGIGAGTLTKSGAGTLTLNAANTYTGLTTISGGTLRYGVSDALGTGGITLTNGATLDIAAFSDSVGAVTLTLGSIVGTGTLTSTGNFTMTTGTISVPLAGSAAGIRQLASGTTVLTAANTFGAAGTVAADGVLHIQNSAALGSTAAGLTVSDGGALWLSGNIAVGTNALSVRGVGVGNGGLRNVSGTNSYAGVVTLSNALTMQSDAGLLTLSGTLTGATRAMTFQGAGDITLSGSTIVGSIIKNGTGRLTISGGNGTAGVTTINAGVVRAASDSALGTTAGATTVASGAALELAGTISIGPEPLTLNGTGVSGAGALRNVTGTNTFGGAVTFASAATIVADAGTRLDLTSTLGGNFLKTFQGEGLISAGGIISGAAGLTMDGPGTLTLSAANTYTGTTSVLAGTLVVTTTSGLGAATSAVVLGDASNPGTLSYTGNSASYTRGFTLGAAGGRLVVTTAGQALTVATGNVTGSGTFTVGGAGDAVVSSALSQSGGLVKTGAGTLTLSSSNTYAGPTAIEQGTVAANQIVVTAAASSLGNAATAVSLGGASTVGTLSYTGTSATYTRGLTLGAGGGRLEVATLGTTLTLATGGVSGVGSLTVGGSGDLVAASALTQSGGLTMAGSGTLALSGANTFPGTLAINSGVVRATTSAQALGAGSVTLGGGNLELANDTGLNFGRDLTVATSGTIFSERLTAGAGVTHTLGGLAIGSQTLALATDATVTSGTAVLAFSSHVTLTGNPTFDTAAGTDFVFTDGFLGGFSVTKTGSGSLTLDGDGGGQANTTVSAGRLNVNSLQALGTLSGTLSLAAGTTLGNTSGNAVTVGNAKSISLGSSVTFAGPSNLNLGDGVTTLSATNTTIDISAGTLTFGGNVVGSGLGITKTGAGTLVFTHLGAGGYTGNTTVSQGELYLDGLSVFAGGTTTIVTVEPGAYLRIGASASLGNITIDTWGGGLITGTVQNVNVNFTASGTLTLDDTFFNGTQTITSDVVISSTANYFGTIPASPVADRIAIQNNATLRSLSSFNIEPTQGVVLTSGTATFDILGSGGQRLFVESVVSGSGALRKTGANNLRLLGDNSYTGGTIIEQGIIGIVSDASLGAVTGGVQILGSELVGAQTASGSATDVTIAAARSLTIGNGMTSAISAQSGNRLAYAGAIAETDGLGTAGNLRIGLAGPRAGTVVLGGLNTYRGSTTLAAGTLEVAVLADGGVASGVGQSSSAAANLVLQGGGTLKYSGANGSTDRLFTLGAGGATIDSGSGSLAFTNSGSAALAGSGARTFTLTGNGSASLAAVMADLDTANKTSLTKSGAGTWLLTSIQNFTGTARVDAGILAIDGANTLASASKIFVATGGTLGATAAGLTIPSGQTLGGYGRVDVGTNALTFNSGAFLSPGGSVGTLNETGATTWNGGMTYVFEVNDADGTPGIDPGWDLFNTTGDLTLAASSGNKIVVDLTSLNGASPGSAADFNQNYSYAWKFVVAGSAIGTFDSSWFNVTTTNFSNDTNGSFYVARGDQLGGIGASGANNELYVIYAATPEPGAIALAAIGLGILGWRLRRRPRVRS